MDEPRENLLSEESQTQINIWFHLYEMLKRGKWIETMYISSGQGLGEADGEWLLSGDGVSVQDDEKFWN